VTVWGAVEWSRLHLSLKQVRAEEEAAASVVATSGAHSEASGLKETVTRTNAA